MDFRNIFSVKKADNSANLAAGGVINRRTHHNSPCRDKNKQQVTSYVMVYKAMSHVTVTRMRELSPAQSYFKTGGLPPISSSWRRAP
jgi:hypothetical protein